jgi:hypothetical protein
MTAFSAVSGVARTSRIEPMFHLRASLFTWDRPRRKETLSIANETASTM